MSNTLTERATKAFYTQTKEKNINLNIKLPLFIRNHIRQISSKISIPKTQIQNIPSTSTYPRFILNQELLIEVDRCEDYALVKYCPVCNEEYFTLFYDLESLGKAIITTHHNCKLDPPLQ